MAGPKLSSISLPFAMMKNSASEENDTKKPRRSERISSQTQTTPLKEKLKSYLPSPLTHQESTRSDDYKESTASPPEGRPSQIRHRTPISPPAHYTQGLSSPPSDTQAFSQLLKAPGLRSWEVEDEEGECVWGYLVPVDPVFGERLVCRARAACPAPYPSSRFGKGTKNREKIQTVNYIDEEKQYEAEKRSSGFPAGGYLIGRHLECGTQILQSTGGGFDD